MRRQFAQQILRLLATQETNASRGFFQQAPRWRSIQPVPFTRASTQDGSHQRQRAIDRCIATALCSLRLGDRTDQCSIDLPDLQVHQIMIKPAQLAPVLLVGRLVALLAQPTLNSVLPGALRSIPQSVKAPSIVL